MTTRILPVRCAWVGALALLALPLSGQVPDGWDGWVVASAFRSTEIGFPGDGGLWLIHPRIPGPPIPVTGLGPDLTGAGLPGPLASHGANCVLRLPDGRLAVGETGRAVAIDLHVISLAGTSVGGDAPLFCGTATALGEGGGVHQLALLPDGRVLMAVWGIAGGPLAGESVGIADLAAGTVAGVAVSGTNGSVNALALDASGTTAYFGTFQSESAGAIYSLAAPADGGTVAHVANLPAGVLNLALDNDGGLLAGCFGSDVFKVDPSTGIVTPLGLAPMVCNALAVESVTGNYFVGQHTDPAVVPPSGWVSLVEPGPALTQLLLPPPGGWGVLSGMDVNHNPSTYGPASPGASSYEWMLAPNPRGLPLVGSAFSLTLAADPGGSALAGLFVMGQDPYVPGLPALGVVINVDFASIIFSKPLLGTPQETVGLTIPPQPALVGVTLYAQAGYLELGGYAASSGLELTIL